MSDPRHRPLGPLLGLLFLSGLAALGVEVLWAQMLHRILGSTSLSVTSVLAGFLGGLGLGGWLGERLLRRIRSPIRAYAAAELAALGATLLFPSLLEISSSFFLRPAGKWLLPGVTALLAVPWGVTFPVVVAALPPGPALGRSVRRVYGVNALGAAAGGLAAGLIALPYLGEWGALGCFAAAEAAAAAGAILLSRAPGWEGFPPAAGAGTGGLSAPSPDGSRAPGGALPFLLLSGLLVIYWEVLWTRILVLVVGSTVYSFSVIASSVVLGIAVGSLSAGGRWISRHAGWILPAAAALLLAGGYLAIPHLPEAYLAGVRQLGLPPLLSGVLGAAAVVFLPNVLLGSLFPWAVAPRARAAGRCYAVSCAGSLLGAFAAGPLGAVLLSLEDAYRAGVAGLAALAVLGAILAAADAAERLDGAVPSGRRRAWTAPGGIAAASALGLAVLVALRASPLGRPWDPRMVLSGVYQWSPEDLVELPLREAASSREILGIFAGREVIVSVELDRAANTVYIRGNGKVEGSVPADPGRPSLADLPTQLLLGAYPAWLLGGGARGSPGGVPTPEGGVPLPAAGDPADSPAVLLIGLGSGVTLGALARGLEPAAAGGARARIDVIEIEEAFLDAIRSEAARPYLERFVPAEVLAPGGVAGGGEPRGERPSRIRVHFGDARRVLSADLRGARWDAIVSQPSEPWIPGAAPLFTLEFFETAAGHLHDGGIFIQWLQLYKLDLEKVRLIVRTFRRVFPEVSIARPPGTGELILIGSRERPRWEELLRSPVEPWLGGVGLEVPADRLAALLLGPRAVDGWVGLSPALPVNRDSRGDLAHAAARSLYRGRELASRSLAALRELGGGDPFVRYLPPGLREDPTFRRLLSWRNVRVGDLAEAAATLGGDDSAAARQIRPEIEAREP